MKHDAIQPQSGGLFRQWGFISRWMYSQEQNLGHMMLSKDEIWLCGGQQVHNPTLKMVSSFVLSVSMSSLWILLYVPSFSHPDNALEACGLLTHLHTVPEWYFLFQHMLCQMLCHIRMFDSLLVVTCMFNLFYLMICISSRFNVSKKNQSCWFFDRLFLSLFSVDRW